MPPKVKQEPVSGSKLEQETVRPAPTAPSFGMCEGVRADLEQVDKTTDPFTGKVLTRDDVTVTITFSDGK